MSHGWRRAGSWKTVALKTMILLVIVVLLIRRVPLRTIGALAHAFPVTALVGIAGLSVPWFLFRLLKWSLLLRAFSIHLCHGDRMGSLSLGIVAGSFTPLQAGEMARVLPVRGGLRIAVGTLVLVDKAMDLTILVVLAAAGFLVGRRNVAAPLSLAAVQGATIPGWARRVIGSRWEEVRNGLGAIRPAPAAPWLLAASFLATVLAYGIVLVQYHLAIRVLAPGHDPRVLAVCPLIMLARAVPLTFAGLGVREGLAAALFPRFGVSPAAAVVVTLLLFVVNLGVPLLGAILWLAGNRPVAQGRGEGISRCERGS